MQSVFSKFGFNKLRLLLSLLLAFSLSAASGGPESVELEEKGADTKEWVYNRENERQSQTNDGDLQLLKYKVNAGTGLPSSVVEGESTFIPLYLLNRCLLFYD